MLRALKAAFLLRWPISGLGDVPINLVAIASLGVLGFGNPGFWLAGIGLETLYLATLTTNRRFLRWVDAQDKTLETDTVEEKRRALIQQLTPPDRQMLDRLTERCDRIESLWRQGDDFLLESNQQALRELQWYYLKLLIARAHLSGPETQSDADTVRNDVVTLERELTQPQLTTVARESKAATMAILRKRLENFGRRQQTLEEIASDLERIEAQVALVLENTTLEGKPQALSTHLDLASQTLDAGIFGSSAEVIADVDAAYSQPAPAKERS
jgi:hypothetical protein